MRSHLIKKPIFFIPTILVFLILLFIFLNARDSNYLNEKKWIRLDSVKVFNRAYKMNSAKTSVVDGYEFRGLNGGTFQITNEQFSSLINPGFIYDTLQYSGTVLTVFTTPEGKKNYDTGNPFTRIPVLQIVLKDKKYVDNSKVISLKLKGFWMSSFFWIGVYFLFMIFVYSSKYTQKKKTT